MGCTNDSPRHCLGRFDRCRVAGFSGRRGLVQPVEGASAAGYVLVARSAQWMWGEVSMTVAGAFLLAWAVGFVLGYKVRLIRLALYAS